MNAIGAKIVRWAAQIANLLIRTTGALSGMTYLFITHDLAVLRIFADDIAVMHRAGLWSRALPKHPAASQGGNPRPPPGGDSIPSTMRAAPFGVLMRFFVRRLRQRCFLVFGVSIHAFLSRLLLLEITSRECRDPQIAPGEMARARPSTRPPLARTVYCPG